MAQPAESTCPQKTLGTTTNSLRFDPPDLKRIRASARACVGLRFFAGWLPGPFSEILERFSGRELFQYCFSIGPILFQYCTSTAVSVLFQYCSSTAPVLLQYCFSAVPILFLYITSIAPVLFQCCPNTHSSFEYEGAAE